MIGFRGAGISLAGIALLLSANCSSTSDRASSRGPAIVAQFRFPPIGLGASQARTWPGLIPDDRGLELGGIFSGLCHAPADSADAFYCAADRGPNEELTIGGETRRTFPVPGYSPLIYELRAERGGLRIVRQIGIRTRDDDPVTGLSNTAADEVPYGYDGKTRLPLNPNGLDVEGLAIASDGTFWLADEYRPSLVHVGADGTVLARLIPRGEAASGDTPFRPVLPEILEARRLNRGFEGVALSRDNAKLYAALESPLEFPSRSIGRASRMVRLLVVDAERLVPIAEYAYVQERAVDLGAGAQDEVRLSDLAYLHRTSLLVVERTPKDARVYQIDLEPATNLLHARWDDMRNRAHPLEGLPPESLASNGIVPVRKSLMVDLERLRGLPTKIEGLTIVDEKTIAVGNDNDFGFSGFDRHGRAILKDAPTILTLVRLPNRLPVERP